MWGTTQTPVTSSNYSTEAFKIQALWDGLVGKSADCQSVDPSSIFRTHLVEELKVSLKVSSDLHTCAMAYTHAQPPNAHKTNK